MAQLFAECFSVKASDPPAGLTAPIYDEVRALSLDPQGRPFVDAGSVAKTVTLTEVRGESSDPDDDELILQTQTITKVRGERPDASQDELGYLGTSTKGPARSSSAPPGERDFSSNDAALLPSLTTETAIAAERPDREAALWAGTRTMMTGEKDDVAQDEVLLEAASRQTAPPGH